MYKNESYSEFVILVSQGEVCVKVLVPELSLAAGQLSVCPVCVVVVRQAAIAHHGRDVGVVVLEHREK